ncbi:hypothetical protein DSO57_1016133 [Entomophthora muscae]|uniref:Uncharacterized protein n=2 Tax=Entomophthora muscae TaxID=34485 RepID=A0ACC2SHN1_9FUNG|nr:hypothetical protein DSO57_1016133 [Entomophthora muscae]
MHAQKVLGCMALAKARLGNLHVRSPPRGKLLAAFREFSGGVKFFKADASESHFVPRGANSSHLLKSYNPGTSQCSLLQAGNNLVRDTSLPEGVVPSFSCYLSEVKRLTQVGDFEAACDGLVNILAREESSQYETQLLDLVSIFISSEEKCSAVKGLELLLQRRVFFPDVCFCPRIRHSILMRAINQSCEVGVFRIWKDFGRHFRDLIILILTETPTSFSNMILVEMLTQAPASQHASMYNATLECFRSKRMTPPCLKIGLELFDKMLELKVVPTAEACECIISCYVTFALLDHSRSTKASQTTMYIFSRVKPFVPYLGKTCYPKLLAMLSICGKGNPAALTERLLIMHDMMENNCSFSIAASCKAISACESLLAYYDAPGFSWEIQRLNFNAKELASRIHAILESRRYIAGISAYALFAILISCFVRLATGDPSSKVELIYSLIKTANDSQDSDLKSLFDAALGPIGMLSLTSMRKALVDMANQEAMPDCKTLNCVMDQYIVSRKPEWALSLFNLLTKEARTGDLGHVPKIMPDAKSFSLAIAAACYMKKFSTMKALWESYLTTCEKNNVASFCYTQIVRSFWIRIITSDSDTSVISESFAIIQQIIRCLDSNPSIGPRGEIYDAIIKSYADILALDPKTPLLNLTTLLDAYSAWILDKGRSACPSVYTRVFNALAEIVVCEPSLRKSILQTANEMSKDMLELQVYHVYHTFGAKIKLFGIGGDLGRLEGAYTDFILSCKKVTSMDRHDILSVFSTYARYCYLDKQKVEAIFDMLAKLGFAPNRHTYFNLLQRLVELEAPISLFWHLLHRLQGQLTGGKKDGELYITPAMIKTVAQYFHRVEGPWSMDQAVEFIRELHPIQTKEAELQLYVFMVEMILIPSRATEEDPTPLVAKWFNRILSTDAEGPARRWVMDALWDISSTISLPPGPFSARARFRKMLERTNDAKHPDPFVMNTHKHKRFHPS